MGEHEQADDASDRFAEDACAAGGGRRAEECNTESRGENPTTRPGWGKDGGNIVRDIVFFGLGVMYISSVWISTFFVGNILALVSYVFIRPLNQVWHESFLDEMARVGWGQIVDYIEHVGRLSPVFTGDLEALSTPDHPLNTGSTGNKIVMSNHCTAGDPVAVFLVGHRLQRIGNMRFMVKKALLFVPVLGVAAYFLDFIFLSRNWNKDEQAIRRVFRSMLEGTRKRLFWICMFPEGTRITSQKLRESHEYATRKNLPILKHVLIPRVKGLHACLIGLRNEADAVLDLTVAYSVRKGETSDLGAVGRGYLANHGKIRPGLADVMLHRSAVRTWPIHIHVRVIPVAEIPTDQVSWLVLLQIDIFFLYTYIYI